MLFFSSSTSDIQKLVKLQAPQYEKFSKMNRNDVKKNTSTSNENGMIASGTTFY